MNIGFSKEALFNRFSDKNPGDVAINEDLGLIVQTLAGPRAIISGKRTPGTTGIIRIGNLLVQFGQIAESGPSFRITFPEPFGTDTVFGFIQEAGNDAPGVYNQAQLDGSNLPDATGMNVIVESGAGNEFYFWFAIGDA